MKKLCLLAALAVTALPALAYIAQGAVGASDDLAVSSAGLHDFMHHKYGPGYGSHDLEGASEDARDMLLLWSLDVAGECEVVPMLDAADLAFADMTEQFEANGLLEDKETKKAYKAVRQDYALLQGFTAAARCVGQSSASTVSHGELSGSL